MTTRSVLTSRCQRQSHPAGTQHRHPTFVRLCAVLVCLACCRDVSFGDEPSQTDAASGLFEATGPANRSEAEPAPSEPGDIPPLPVSEPAPLEIAMQTQEGILGALEAEDAPIEKAEADGPTPHEVEVIRERFPNRTIKIEREVTQDQEGNYVNHGSWKQWDERGNLIAEGRYDMGARTGRWTKWHNRDSSDLFATVPFSQARPPFISQATFDSDLLHGDWTIYDVNQQRLSRITFRNGLRHGPATLWLPTGQIIRQMTYVNGELDGDVFEAGKDGKLVKTATFQNGRRFAEKVTYFKGSRNKETQAQYLFAKLVPKTHDDFWLARFADFEQIGKDERHGLWVTWYENGQIQVQGEYRNDLPVGKFTWWHSNGQKYAEGEFVDGQQHGPWQWWHKNGQKWTAGEFNHGEQTGEWSSWTESGRLDQQASYSGSRPHDLEADQRSVPALGSSRKLK